MNTNFVSKIYRIAKIYVIQPKILKILQTSYYVDELRPFSLKIITIFFKEIMKMNDLFTFSSYFSVPGSDMVVTNLQYISPNSPSTLIRFVRWYMVVSLEMPDPIICFPLRVHFMSFLFHPCVALSFSSHLYLDYRLLG